VYVLVVARYSSTTFLHSARDGCSVVIVVVVDQDKVVVSGDVVLAHGIVHHHNIRVVAIRAEIVIVLFIGERIK